MKLVFIKENQEIIDLIDAAKEKAQQAKALAKQEARANSKSRTWLRSKLRSLADRI